MKTQRMTFAASLTFTPENADRTARRGVGQYGETVEYKTWPARAAMARSIRMQQKRAGRADDWRACVPLGVTEGY